MAWALVGSRLDVSTNFNGFTGGALNTVGADLLICQVSEANSNGTLTDSQSNTWVPLTLYGSARTARLFYVVGPTTNAAHTISISGTGNAPALVFSAWSGADLAAAFDKENGNNNPFGTTVQTGAVTPAATGSLVVTGFCMDIATAATIDGGFTIAQVGPTGGFGSEQAAFAYLIQTSIVLANPTWTRPSGSANLSAGIAVFKGASAPAVPPHWFPVSQAVRGKVVGTVVSGFAPGSTLD